MDQGLHDGNTVSFRRRRRVFGRLLLPHCAAGLQVMLKSLRQRQSTSRRELADHGRIADKLEYSDKVVADVTAMPESATVLVPFTRHRLVVRESLLALRSID